MTRLTFRNGPGINIVILDKPEEQARGLSGWPSLPEDQGILFVAYQPKFWHLHTRDMRFPLDFIFFYHEKCVDSEFARELIVSNTISGVIPGRDDIVSGVHVRFVLEVNGGFIRKHGIRLGQLAHVVNQDGARYVL